MKSPLLPAIILGVALALWGSPARAQDMRETDARQAFFTGEYQTALDHYVELYGETFHPTYLRNVGRCYQMLGQPEKALNAFREYLASAHLTVQQRGEVEGYMQEMEALKRRRAAANRAAAVASPLVALDSSPPPAAASSPPARRWLWWAIGGVTVAAGATLAVALSGQRTAR